MKVAFHSNTLGMRGSENALWDYAHWNEVVLGNRSVICHREYLGREENPVFLRWKERFPLIAYRTKAELAKRLEQAGVSVLYQIKPGPFDGWVVPGVRNCMHAMFLSDEFHGDRYAYVSAWVSRVMTGKEDSFVPHFVPRLESPDNLRARLGIPAGARVFGRHGAWDTFNIPFVRDVVARHARQNPEDHFVFLNTEPIWGTGGLANVHDLPATADLAEKAKFLATCDAMLHARWHGETFGLAVGEFAVLGKPVITYGGSRERAHLDMLGPHGLIYREADELRRILRDFSPRLGHSTEYESWADAARVMELFRKRFLE